MHVVCQALVQGRCCPCVYLEQQHHASASSNFQVHLTEPQPPHPCVGAPRFAVAALRELCINNCKCRRTQSDEDIIMAKQQGNTWVDPALQPEMGSMTPRSARLAISLGQ